MVAERDGHEAHAARVGARRLGQLENSFGRKCADGQVVVTGPAEAAQVCAAADHFDKHPGTEFGVGCEDRGHGRVDGVGGLERGLPNRHGRLGAVRQDSRAVTAQHSVWTVLGFVQGRDVEAALPGQPLQQVGAVRRRAERAPESGDQRFALAGSDDVGERRKGFGIDERHRSADHDKRVTLAPLGRIARDAGQAQQREHIDVVPLERHREGDDVKIADRRLRLERDQRRPGGQQILKFLLRRQEHALAHHIVFRVEEAVDGLKAEVRHPDPVGVREGQGDAQTIAMRLDDVADFFREGFSCAFALCPGTHGRSGR